MPRWMEWWSDRLHIFVWILLLVAQTLLFITRSVLGHDKAGFERKPCEDAASTLALDLQVAITCVKQAGGKALFGTAYLKCQTLGGCCQTAARFGREICPCSCDFPVRALCRPWCMSPAVSFASAINLFACATLAVLINGMNCML